MRTVLLIAFCIIIGSTFSTIIAAAWTAPTATPPGANVSSPVNVGSTQQLKNGTLGVNGLGVFGDTILSGSGIDGTPPAYLNFGSTAGTNGYGIRNNAGTLEFKNLNSSWGSLNTTLINLMTVNGITPNGIGQITSIKFGDGTTQTTANPWLTNGTGIYYNGGNVGIGTQSPAANLHIWSNINQVVGADHIGTSIQIETPGTGGYQQAYLNIVTRGDGNLLGLSGNNLGWAIGARGHSYSDETEPDAFYISYWNGTSWIGSNYFRIEPNGNVGVGNLHPAYKLDINSTGGSWPTVNVNKSDDNWTAIGMGPGGNAATTRRFMLLYGSDQWTSNDVVFSAYDRNLNWLANVASIDLDAPSGSFILDGSGNITTNWITATGYGTRSDARLKENIQTFANGLQTVERLRGVTFDWKKDGTPSTGVIAQEVEKVLPSAVKTNPDGMKTVDYDQLVAPMIEAIKEQQNQIDALTKKTDAQAQETDTKKLCISSGTTQTCITQHQLAALLASHATCTGSN